MAQARARREPWAAWVAAGLGCLLERIPEAETLPEALGGGEPPRSGELAGLFTMLCEHQDRLIRPEGPHLQDVARWTAYGHLACRFHSPEMEWLGQGGLGHLSTPFSVRWLPRPGLALPVAEDVVQLEHSATQFRCDPGLMLPGGRTDERAQLRILSWEDSENGLRITASRCRADEVTATHGQLSARVPEACEALWQTFDGGHGQPLPLAPTSRLPNGLSVHGLVVVGDALPLPLRRDETFPLVLPPVSGPALAGATLSESCLAATRTSLGVDDEQIGTPRLLGFARNHLRGGEPHASFLVPLAVSADRFDALPGGVTWVKAAAAADLSERYPEYHQRVSDLRSWTLPRREVLRSVSAEMRAILLLYLRHLDDFAA